MVNNPNLFAFMPYDPISNTTGTFSSGRFYTNHELDMPLNFWQRGPVRAVRAGPGGGMDRPARRRAARASADRRDGAHLGARRSTGRGHGLEEVPMDVESELMNVHGLNNKISLFVDARAAYSNVKLNNIAVQDDLDDNTYEYVRRYLALTSFTGGILPMPYDPRHLIVAADVIADHGHDRRAGVDRHGADGGAPAAADQARADRQAADRRLHDARRHDHLFSRRRPRQFRHALGPGHVQLPVVHRRPDEHRLGGLVRFLQAGGKHTSGECDADTTPTGSTSSRRGSRSAGRRAPTCTSVISIIDTGPIKTSAVNVSLSYWLSPKWYGTFSESYDFGDAVSLGSMFAFTRIGADYLTTIGLSVDPQRQSYMFAFQITPRSGSGNGLGGGSTASTFDTRFAPTQ